MSEPGILRQPFGFLRYPHDLCVGDIDVTLMPDYENSAKLVAEAETHDGFLCHPRFRRVQPDPTIGAPGKVAPATLRPGFLWHVQPSHILEARSSLDPDDFRRETGLFVIHLIAYFFGTRLQFHDWWVDSRVPTKPNADLLNPSAVAEPFLSGAYERWCGWPAKDRVAAAGLLFMHSRVPGYEWPWERFAFEYMTFDGLYALAAPGQDLPARGMHSDRIRLLCGALGIPIDSPTIDRIVAVRNELVHEVSFGGEPPGFSGHGAVFALPLRLRALNRRIIAALLGWDRPFVHSPWWALDSVPFDI
jgi:hypothetical protein